MSCEGCSQKFTVFKRKKMCNICLRYFCSHCLSPQIGAETNNSVLARLTDRRYICATCLVLTARPLCRLQLKRLKVKDLQHYLTAQRVSTRGCVEKDDLVNLLIRHVGGSNNGSRQENVCDSHSDLSMGNEQNLFNSTNNRPSSGIFSNSFSNSRAPSVNPCNSNSSSNPRQTFSDSSARCSANSNIKSQTKSNAKSNTKSSSGSSSSSSSSSSNSSSSSSNTTAAGKRVGNCKRTTKSDMDDGFEIVELTDDWSGDNGEQGPVPVVEEISDSVGDSSSSATSPTSGGDQNTINSSTTSLGEPNVSSSSSSPSHENIPVDSSNSHGRAVSSSNISEDVVHNSENHDLKVPSIITLNTIKTLGDLQKMSVKQIKELLMRNRVDFRGCCERAELVERATRLWVENQESRKALERLGSAEMCKICMDAPIECVMLECGHMATCMSCGKQLSECPLCRQYVVRVVRTFRA